MSETEFVLFQNIIGGIETFLYAVCLTAFFYPFMTEKKERQGSKLKKILIVFGSYIAISLIGNFVPAYGWLGLMIVIILFAICKPPHSIKIFLISDLSQTNPFYEFIHLTSLLYFF